MLPRVWGAPCPPHLSSLPQQALQGIGCSQSQGLDGDRRGPTQSCGVAPGPPSTPLCGVRVHASVSAGGPPPAGAGGAAGCMGVRAESRARCSVRARLCPVCHVYPDLARCHSQYSAVKEQCGPLFLSERKNEQLVCLRLVAPQKGWVLLGTHPPACTASRRVQHHTGPLPRPLATCAWGGWPSLLPPCCPVIGPSSSFRKPPSAA